MGKVPAFFKVYLSTSSQRLPLPLAFCSIIKGATSGRAFLRNFSGQLWPVKVSKFGDQWFFDDGWAEFVEANHVKVGDFFVFDYTGNSTFDFKLLGGDRCGKTVTWSPEELPDLEEQDDETDGEESDEEDQEYAEGEEENADTDDMQAEDYQDDDFQKRKVENITKSSKAADANKGKSSHQVEGAYPTNEPIPNGETHNLDVDSDCVIVEDDQSAEEAGDPKRKRPSSKCCEETEDIFQYGLITPPKNPYFIAKRGVKRSGSARIPRDVINDFNLRIPPNLKLLDENGREWTTRVKFWKDGRVWITKGWRSFCKWNHLRPEDRCICEFIRQNGLQEVKLKTRIVRKRSWLP